MSVKDLNMQSLSSNMFQLSEQHHQMMSTSFEKQQGKNAEILPETADDDQVVPFQKIMEQAIKLLQRKDWRALIECCSQGLSQKLQPELYLMKAKALGKLGKHDQKVKLIKKAIELDATCAAYYRSLGATHYKLKKFEKALNNHMKSIDIQPDNSINYHNAGTSLFRLGRFDQAQIKFKKSINLSKYHAHSYRWLGNTYKETKQYQKALECYERAYDIGGKEIDKKQIQHLEQIISPWKLMLNSLLICG